MPRNTPVPSFQPSYHEQQRDYRDAHDDEDVQRTMKTILFPLQVSQANMALTSAQQNIDAQKMAMDETTRKTQDQMDRDHGYADMAAQLRDSAGGNTAPIEGHSAEATKGALSAIFDHRRAHLSDATSITKAAVDQAEAEMEARVRTNSDLLHPDDWADPVKKKQAYLNDQIGPIRSALGGKAFGELHMSDDRTASEWMADPKNYSVSGRLLRPIADELNFAGSEFKKSRDEKAKADALAAQTQTAADIHKQSTIDTAKEIDNGQKAEREAAHKENHLHMLRKDAEELASTQLAKNPATQFKLGTPEGDAMIAKNAAEIVKRWTAAPGDEAPAKPAAPERTATNAKGEKMVFRNGAWQPLP